MHQISFIYIVVPQQKWNNTYLKTTYKLQEVSIASFYFQDKELARIIILSSFKKCSFIFKRVEIFCSLKRVRTFAPYGWTNVRQRYLTCGGLAERAFYL